jgi:hypothetical protein
MLANWINGMGEGLGGLSAALEQGALVYLLVSLLGPLSWLLVVEICRRARESEAEWRNPLAHGALVRLALPAAKLTRPSSPEWLENQPEES